MSLHETHNVLFASGPDFKKCTTIDSPTGNVDIAPTVLHLLGLPGAEAMHGRVLREALLEGPETVDWNTAVHSTECHILSGRYRQKISVSRVNETHYVNHGTGELQFC